MKNANMMSKFVCFFIMASLSFAIQVSNDASKFHSKSKEETYVMNKMNDLFSSFNPFRADIMDASSLNDYVDFRKIAKNTRLLKSQKLA